METMQPLHLLLADVAGCKAGTVQKFATSNLEAQLQWAPLDSQARSASRSDDTSGSGSLHSVPTGSHRSKEDERRERARLRNRRAQARYRERQKVKQAEDQSDIQALALARQALAKEKEEFEGMKAAWLAQRQSVSLITAHVTPDATTLMVSSYDTCQVAVCKTPGMPKGVLDLLHDLARTVFEVCGWPVPGRQQTDMYIVGRAFERKQQWLRGLAKLVARFDASRDPEDFNMLQALVYARNIVCRAIGCPWSSPAMLGGNELLKAIEISYNESVVHLHGLPPVDHWHTVVAAMQLTSQQRTLLLQLRQRFQLQVVDARQRASSIPDDMQSFLHSGQAYKQGPYAAGYNLEQGEACHSKLQECLREHYNAARDLYFGVREQALTAYQLAKMELAGYPYPINLQSICDAVAQQETAWQPVLSLPAIQPPDYAEDPPAAAQCILGAPVAGMQDITNLGDLPAALDWPDLPLLTDHTLKAEVPTPSHSPAGPAASQADSIGPSAGQSLQSASLPSIDPCDLPGLAGAGEDDVLDWLDSWHPDEIQTSAALVPG